MNKMPKKVINDYTFYKIVCLDNSVELCYVGSTADFNKRRSSHKSICNNENSNRYNLKIYKTIRDNGGWDNFKMIEIGKKEQLTNRQAEQIEDEYRQELKANMNSKKCYLTEEQNKEYQQKYRDKNKEYQQKWCEENKDKISKHKQKYRDENRDKIKKYQQKWCEENKDKISKHQQKYRDENRDKIKKRNQKYRDENRDKISEKVKCDCGCMISKSHLSTHQKSPKHIKLMNQLKTGNENI